MIDYLLSIILYILFLYESSQRTEDNLHVEHETIGLSVAVSVRKIIFMSSMKL